MTNSRESNGVPAVWIMGDRNSTRCRPVADYEAIPSFHVRIRLDLFALLRMYIQSKPLGRKPFTPVSHLYQKRQPVTRCVSVCAAETKMDVGFVGLGIMGEPMAQNLLASGKFASVTIWNRTQSKVSCVLLPGENVVLISWLTLL